MFVFPGAVEVGKAAMYRLFLHHLYQVDSGMCCARVFPFPTQVFVTWIGVG